MAIFTYLTVIHIKSFDIYSHKIFSKGITIKCRLILTSLIGAVKEAKLKQNNKEDDYRPVTVLGTASGISYRNLLGEWYHEKSILCSDRTACHIMRNRSLC